MGISKNFIVKSKRNFKGEALQEDKLVRQTITSLRESCKEFYIEVYNYIYKSEDDKELLNMYNKSKDDGIENETEKIKKIARSTRVNLVFKKDPFANDIPLNEILQVAALGALEESEFMSLLRSRFNLETKFMKLKNPDKSFLTNTNEAGRKVEPTQKSENTSS